MRSLRDWLVNLGVTPETPPDLALVLRATNMASMLLMVVSLAAIGMSLADARNPLLALGFAVPLILYVCVLALNGAGFPLAGRVGFVAVACLHYSIASVVLGADSGNRVAIIALVLCPILGTLEEERGLVALGFATIAVSFVVSELLNHRIGPFVDWSPAQLQRANYFNLIVIAGTVALAARHYQNLSRAARHQLDAANRRIAELLANVLPPPIAARLQERRDSFAESHGNATVLFAALVGFSALTRRLSPGHLIEILDLMFSRFDEAATDHRIEKIKTIGDCYMAATGVLSEAEGASAVEAVADFSLAVLDIVRDVSSQIGITLGVRVGISTGPVVSGVIGRQKYSFDIWGDTVNRASRMQSTGVTGQVQVSERTFWRLQHAFDFETRGVIALKGEESATAYLLRGRKPASVGSAAATAVK
jgi:adenylate cyclase